MDWLQILYASPLFIAAIVSFILALRAWGHRSAPGAKAFALLMLAAAVWSQTYALSLANISQEAKLLWIKVRYIGIVIVPSAWLVFSLQQTNRGQWATRRNLILLTIEPLVILLMIWTNQWHRLYWVETYQVQLGPFTIINASHGPFFWVHVVYSYLLIVIGSIFLIQMALSSPHVYRRQALAALFSAVGPLVGDVLSTFGILPTLSWLDLTPFFFTVSGIIVAWAFFRFRLLDIVPVARDAIVKSMSDGVIVLDADSRIVDLNPVAEGILDCPVWQALGKPAEQILARWPDLVERYGRIAETHTEITVGEGVVRRCFDLRISPLRDWRKHLSGRLIVLRDITERKSMEEELQKAKVAAEEANQAKNEFITLVAHELRSPMSAIEGSASLLAEQEVGPITEEQAEFLDIIESNVSRMATLVSDLNDISLIESGRLHLMMGSVSLSEIVEQVVRSNRVQIKRKHLQLNLDISPDLPPVRGDRYRLEQVLTNIVVNAWKFTPEGGEITICSKRDSYARDGQEPQEVVHISVADTGLGISPEDQDKIFLKFFRTKREEAREIPGTGLGLSLAKDLVEMHGGQIWFESNHQEGTTFHFTVPAAKEED